MSLTVEPFRVVFECALEGELLSSSGQVVEVRTEDDRVGLGEFSVGTGIKTGLIAWIAMLHPDGSSVVSGVVGTFCNARPNTRDEDLTI